MLYTRSLPETGSSPWHEMSDRPPAKKLLDSMVSAGSQYHWLIPALRGLPDQSVTIFTDSRGRKFSPAELAQEIESWTDLGQLIVAVEGVVALALLGSEVNPLEVPSSESHRGFFRAPHR